MPLRAERSNLNIMSRYYYVYILASPNNNVVYTGVTGKALLARVWEHKQKMVLGFTKKYNVTKLVYYEVFEDIYAAIGREKQIKAGSRKKKMALIESMNPGWRDLYHEIS